MTKQELLASLKPLEWRDKLRGTIYADTKFGWYSILIDGTYSDGKKTYEIYFSLAERSAYYTYVVDEYICEYLSLEVAKQAAQEHYNNLVLSLFDLEA